MKYMITIIAVMFIFLTGCEKKQPKSPLKGIFGEMAVKNETKTTLDVSIDSSSPLGPIDFGVIVPQTGKSMGGGHFELGKDLKVVWQEDYDSDNPVKGEASFDTNKLADIAEQIKGMEFVYVGNKKWKLRLYKALHRYEKDLIREIDSE